MKRSNLILTILSTLIIVSNSLAQSAKFDIMTYAAPAGWTAEKDANALRFTKESGSNYCVISLTRSVDGVGDSGKNFELLWKGMATDGLNAGTPQRGSTGDRNGWQTEIGVAMFEKDGLKGAALLTTFTGNGKVVAILAITNSDEFQPAIEAFVDSVKLPPIAIQKAPAAASAAAPSGDAAKLVGKWNRSGSVSPVYADPVSWGTAGYTKSRYEFKADGTYFYTERSFRMMYQHIIIVKENGRYAVSGNTLTIKPAKSVIASYTKAGGVDALGALVKSQARPLETVNYRFTFHYFSGIQEWNLVLQADEVTQRDGSFSNNTTFPNAWYFDQKFTDNDLTAVRAG